MASVMWTNHGIIACSIERKDRACMGKAIMKFISVRVKFGAIYLVRERSRSCRVYIR